MIEYESARIVHQLPTSTRKLHLETYRITNGSNRRCLSSEFRRGQSAVCQRPTVTYGISQTADSLLAKANPDTWNHGIIILAY